MLTTVLTLWLFSFYSCSLSSPAHTYLLEWCFRNINLIQSPLLKIILWLPMFLGLNFKILALSCQTLHDSVSLTFSDHFTFCAPASLACFGFLQCVAFLLASRLFHKSSFLSKWSKWLHKDYSEDQIRGCLWQSFISWPLSDTVRWKTRAKCNTRSRIHVSLHWSGTLIFQEACIKTPKSSLILFFPLSSFPPSYFPPSFPYLPLQCYFLISHVEYYTDS